jgi:hypothetical protein
MGTPEVFRPEKLVIAMLVSRIGDKDAILEALRSRFGPIDFQSPLLPFAFTGYYTAEMGPVLHRMFASFAALVNPDTLAGIKLATNALEDLFREGGGRRANLDPGLLSLGRFSLASVKNGPHRIPLERGIYAEVTLLYERGSFRPVEWTYPDYRSAGYISVLNAVRVLYKTQLRSPAPE